MKSIMKRMLIAAPIAAVFLAAAALAADNQSMQVEEVVVTASRMEEKASETTSPVVIITQEELRASGQSFAVEALRRVTDLAIVQNGGPGKQASVLLRGANSNQVVVLIDGMRVKSAATGAFDFGSLMVEDIERIEIVKGPQSTMYGSEAIGGVINIITKKGKGPVKFDLGYEAGSFGTRKPSIGVSGGSEGLDYRVSASRLTTDGISAHKDGTEADGYESSNISGRIGTNFGDAGSFEFNARRTEDEAELDDMSGDDLDYIQKGERMMLSGRASLDLDDGVEQIFTASRYTDDLKYVDPTTTWNNAELLSRITAYEAQTNVINDENNSATLGLEYRTEEGENKGAFDKAISSRAAYVNFRGMLGPLNISFGGRYDDHEVSGSDTTWRVGLLQKDEDVRYRASYATGFRAPTLNELYYSDPWGSTGNPNLEPEESSSWEVGFDWDMAESATLGITYFDQSYKNLIEWVEVAPWAYSTENVDKASIKGIEVSLGYRPTKQASLRAAYTYLDTENKATGKPLTARPESKLNIGGSYELSSWLFGANYSRVGERYDGMADKDLDPYDILDLNVQWKVWHEVRVYARMDNVLDEEYEEMSDYNTPGRATYAGVRASF